MIRARAQDVFFPRPGLVRVASCHRRRSLISKRRSSCGCGKGSALRSKSRSGRFRKASVIPTRPCSSLPAWARRRRCRWWSACRRRSRQSFQRTTSDFNAHACARSRLTARCRFPRCAGSRPIRACSVARFTSWIGSRAWCPPTASPTRRLAGSTTLRPNNKICSTDRHSKCWPACTRSTGVLRA